MNDGPCQDLKPEQQRHLHIRLAFEMAFERQLLRGAWPLGRAHRWTSRIETTMSERGAAPRFSRVP
jgi:hypothetical protein